MGMVCPGRGFALVVTLALVALLVLLGVGMLSLGAVGMRVAGLTAGEAEARANARVAMWLALGEIQKLAGPDTRVTARADLLDETYPLVTGVWQSWEGTDHELSGAAQGRPVSPGDYRGKKDKRFLGWLTSGAHRDAKGIPDVRAGGGKAVMVGAGSVSSLRGGERQQVHLEPLAIGGPGGGRGGFAWWAGGENQKARQPAPYEPLTDSAGRWALQAKTHAVADPGVFRMDRLLEHPAEAEKVVTRGGADHVAGASVVKVSREHFHDLSATSVGLLTNVATGGWRKDFSLLTENWSKVGTSHLPFFRVKPGTDILSNLPTAGNPVAARSMLYPWSAYRGSAGNIAIYQHGAVSSWEHLKDYVLAYRDKGMVVTAGGNAKMPPYSVAIDGNVFSFLHRVRVLPVIARIQWVFSHWSAKLGGNYEPRLLLTPVVTLWNPYNVEIAFGGVPLDFSIPRPLPAALKYTVNGVAQAEYRALTAGSSNYPVALSDAGGLSYQIGTSFTLRPGETRVFSPVAGPVAAGALLSLQPGYRSRGGHYFVVKDASGVASVPAAATMRAEAKFDTVYNDSVSGGVQAQGVGIYLDMAYGGARHLVYRMVYTPKVANDIYKPVSGLAASPPMSALPNNPVPFLTTIFGARMASRTHIAAKGFVQSSPLVNYTAMGGKDLTEVTIARHYGGTKHPVNSPFDYSFEKVAPAGDSLLPNENEATGRGYIVTGFTKADGLSRCVIAELPTRPLVSLGELQHWDLRYENPIPPFAFNLIGNSDASPLLPANAVVNSADAGLATNLQHDDSYCANHLLYDDWFFSSITRDPANFGSGGTVQKTYVDFLTGRAPLGNRAYRPLMADVAEAGLSPEAANELYLKHAGKGDSWRTIASRLEVEGMFNVNSTSVTAWRALLGHARGQRVPYLKESAGGWGVDLSGRVDHPVSRFSVAGDVDAGGQGGSGAFPESAEFAGYRLFDEKMLDALAEGMVAQVRLRGPFLSLAEFVNRQLSSGELALAGAVQTALNGLAGTQSTNPYGGITAVISRPAVAVPPSAGEAEYKFRDAAVGEATYGLPGWTRQADVLRPLAPVLSVRDDTFTVRAHGEARDRAGKVTARVVCEAVVRRTREYVDPADAADAVGLPRREVNVRFGRRFEVVSFRWLGDGEL